MLGTFCVSDGSVESAITYLYVTKILDYNPTVVTFSHMPHWKTSIVFKYIPTSITLKSNSASHSKYQSYYDILSILDKFNYDKFLIFVPYEELAHIKFPNVELVCPLYKNKQKKYLDKLLLIYSEFKDFVVNSHNCDQQNECRNCDKCLNKALLLTGIYPFRISELYLLRVMSSLDLRPKWFRKLFKRYWTYINNYEEE